MRACLVVTPEGGACTGEMARLADGWACDTCHAVTADTPADAELSRLAEVAAREVNAPWCRCIVCGAMAGEPCKPDCAGQLPSTPGRCDVCGAGLAFRGAESACGHCDPETVGGWIAELEDVESVEARASLSPAELGCYHRAGDVSGYCSNPECPAGFEPKPPAEPVPPPTLGDVLQPVLEAADAAARGFGVLVIVYAPDGSYKLGGRAHDHRRTIGLLFSAASSLDRFLG